MRDIGDVIAEVRKLQAKCTLFEESTESLIQTIKTKNTQMEVMATEMGRLTGRVNDLMELFMDKAQQLQMPQHSSAFPKSVIPILKQLESGLSAMKTFR